MKLNKIFAIMTVLTCLAIGVNAVEFYSGGVIITNMDSSVIIGTEAASISVNYTLKNTKNQSTDLILMPLLPESATGNITKVDGILYAFNVLTFAPEEQKKITLEYNVPVISEEVKMITFNPELLFNGLYQSEKIGEYKLTITMPPGIKNIISSNPDFTRKIEGERTVYEWEKSNSYSTSITVTWTDLQYNITVEKDIAGVEDFVFRVTNTIRNFGTDDIENIELRDSFFPGLFEPVWPMEDFEHYSGDENDLAWIWTKKINKLSKGENASFSYDIKVLNPTKEIKFEATKVWVNERLVSVSNEKILINEEEGCGNMICDPGETHDNCPEDCAEIKTEECNSAYDGYCNPECPDIDLDCMPPSEEETNSLLILFVVIVIVVTLVVYFKILKGKKKK